MRRPRADYGPVFWLRFGEWCRARQRLLATGTTAAVQLIRDEFGVSRATAYRWLAAWREVRPNIEGGSP